MSTRWSSSRSTSLLAWFRSFLPRARTSSGITESLRRAPNCDRKSSQHARPMGRNCSCSNAAVSRPPLHGATRTDRRLVRHQGCNASNGRAFSSEWPATTWRRVRSAARNCRSSPQFSILTKSNVRWRVAGCSTRFPSSASHRLEDPLHSSPSTSRRQTVGTSRRTVARSS